MPDRNYKKSNAITTTDFPISREARKLSKILLKKKQTDTRQKYSTELLDELTDLAEIDVVNVKVSDAKQYHARSKGRIVMRQYGYYDPERKYIYITNRTAARGQLLAPKTFFDTLIHEWVHHYDHQKLGLRSIHTAGFYARLKDLKEKLGYFEY